MKRLKTMYFVGPHCSCVVVKYENNSQLDLDTFTRHMKNSGFRKCGWLRWALYHSFNVFCMAVFGCGKGSQ